MDGWTAATTDGDDSERCSDASFVLGLCGARSSTRKCNGGGDTRDKQRKQQQDGTTARRGPGGD